MDTNRAFKKVINLVTLCSFLIGNLAIAAPEGGTVVQGSAEISQSANQTVINQTSQNTVINWNSFNTASHESVQFNQPNSSAVALNRITNGLPTEFAGQLNANGQVWILNPAGVLFTNTAKIDVAGLVATTHNISDQNFMMGNYRFDLVPGSESSSIINNGLISAKDSGIIALVAPHVANNGLIQVNLGKVSLSSGVSYVLDMYGDSLINFGSNAPIQNGSVSNTGKIIADGGKVYMTANYASGVLDNMISMSGTIEAKTVGVNNKGEIVLYGGDYQTKAVAGTTKVSGKLNASNGGFIETSGYEVLIDSMAEINAGIGGTWLLDPTDILVDASLASTINGQLNAGANVTLDTTSGGADAGNITISSAITQSANSGHVILTLLADNNIVINAPISLRTGGSLKATAARTTPTGKIFIGANISTTNQIAPLPDLTFNSPVVLTATVFINSDNVLSFGSSIDGAFGLSLRGNTSINGNVGATTPLVSISTNAGSTPVTYGSAVTQVNTTGVQTYTTLVKANSPSSFTFTASTLNLTAQLEGTQDLIINGNVILNPPQSLIGQNTLFRSITISGTTTYATGNIFPRISATGDITMGPVVVQANPSIVNLKARVWSTGGNVTINGTINGPGPFEIIAGGIATLMNTVGVTTPLLSLDVSAGAIHINNNTTQINTAGAQNYSGAMTLGVSSVFNSAKGAGNTGGALTINGAITGNSFDLTLISPVGSGTAVHLNGISITGLNSLTVGSNTIPLASQVFIRPTAITTASFQQYWGPVVFDFVSNVNFTNTNLANAVTFSNTVNGSATAASVAMTITGNLVVGPLGSIGLTSPIGSLLVTGTTLGPNVTTSGNQTYSGPLTLNTDETMISTGGNITYSSTVDGAFNLIARAMAVGKSVTFGGIVGGTTALLSITLNNNSALGTTNINASSVRTSTFQTYNNAVVLGATTTLSSTGGGALNFAAIDSDSSLTPRGLTLTTTGLTTLGNNIGINNLLNALTVTNSVAIGGNIHTVNNQLYGGAATLIANPATPALTTLTSDLGNITFNSTLDGGFNLAVNSASSAPIIDKLTTFNGMVGNSVPLASLTTSGEVLFNTTLLKTTGAQTYNSIVAVQNATNPTNINFWSTGTSDITFKNAVLGGFSSGTNLVNILITGNFVLAGPNGNFQTLISGPLVNSLHVTGTSTFSNPNLFNGLNILNSILLDGPVILAADNVEFVVQNPGGIITFGSTLQSSGGPWSALIGLNAANAVLNFNGIVGGASGSNPLNNLTIPGNAAATININTTEINTLGAQSYGTNVILKSDVTLTSTADGISFSRTVNSDGTPRILTLDAFDPTVLIGNIGNISPLSTLEIINETHINTGIINTTTSQLYDGVVVLGADAVLTTTNAGGFITFFGTLDDTSAGLDDLTINSDQVRFKDNIGSINALDILTVNANIINFDGSVTSVTTLGTQTYTGIGSNPVLTVGVDPVFMAPNFVFAIPVVIAADTTYTSTIGDIDFQSTVDGPANLILNPTGMAIFQGDVGATTALASLTVNGTTTFNRPVTQVVNTVGSQTYSNTVTLATDITMTATGNSGILGNEIVSFGFGAAGIYSDVPNTRSLSVFTHNAANGPSGAGISGTVNVGTFTMGGTGGGDISPISMDSFVGGLGTTGAWDNTFIAPGATGLYCVNGNCTGALTITATDDNKTYGSLFTPTLFSVIGATGGDVISIMLSSPVGSPVTATVLGGPYAIIPSNASSQGITNNHYTSINYVNGSLTVDPAPLVIQANDVTKTYGTLTTFMGTEFSFVSGTQLFNSDSVTSVTLNSAGAPSTANVAGSPYVITPSAAVGSGLSNYNITYNTLGTITVNPAVLTITSLPQTKTEGDFLPLTTTSFMSSGLQNGETVGTVDADSLGLSPSATAGTYPYISVSNAAGGTFDPTNYIINYVIGGDVTVLGGAPINNFNIPPLEIFKIPDGFNPCGIFGCGPTDIILIDPLGGFGIGGIFDITIYPEGYLGDILLGTPPPGVPAGTVISELGDTHAMGELGMRDLGLGTTVYKTDTLVAQGNSCVCIKTVEKDKKCYSNTEQYPQWTHECRAQNVQLNNKVYIKNAVVPKKHTLKDLMAMMKLHRQ